MNLKILDEFNFIKSISDFHNDYFYDCYGVKYDKKYILSLDIPSIEQYQDGVQIRVNYNV
tara:strand:+ start:233 stop:412 length:180 start_codon:yes stop_codon:yes gene_type:complete